MTVSASDIPKGNWIDRLLPAASRPYARLMRLDRPIGTWLLLLPCWWGLAAAPRPDGFAWTDLWYAALFGVGAIVMRGAGCVVNDIIDADYDALVARTADRPIPSGAVSRRQAAAFLLLLLLVGLAILVQFNWTAVWLGIASLALVFPYPLMKRITWWPQAWLGLTFNWGLWLGWAAVTGEILVAAALPTLVLYVAGIAWTLAYDTIYAHQDKVDDALIGVKSTARYFGAASKPWVMGFFIATVVLIGAAMMLLDVAQPASWVFLALAAAQAARQVATWSMDDPHDCLAKFRSNRWFGLLIVAALAFGHY